MIIAICRQWSIYDRQWILRLPAYLPDNHTWTLRLPAYLPDNRLQRKVRCDDLTTLQPQRDITKVVFNHVCHLKVTVLQLQGLWGEKIKNSMERQILNKGANRFQFLLKKRRRRKEQHPVIYLHSRLPHGLHIVPGYFHYCIVSVLGHQSLLFVSAFFFFHLTYSRITGFKFKGCRLH
jgi:hypothetical protein